MMILLRGALWLVLNQKRVSSLAMYSYCASQSSMSFTSCHPFRPPKVGELDDDPFLGLGLSKRGGGTGRPLPASTADGSKPAERS